jgi:hypothetical protein
MLAIALLLAVAFFVERGRSDNSTSKKPDTSHVESKPGCHRVPRGSFKIREVYDEIPKNIKTGQETWAREMDGAWSGHDHSHDSPEYELSEAWADV